MKRPRLPDLQRMSLLRRILLPFFLILILVGTVATIGTVSYMTSFLARDVNERLEAFQQIAYRDIKKQEILLVTYSSLLEYMQALAGPHIDDQTAGALQDQMVNSLRESRISAIYYSPASFDNIPYESLHSLLEQADRSGRPRFRLLDDMGSTPILAVAAPAGRNPAARGIVVLQTPFDGNFLRHLTGGLRVVPHLLTMEGKPLEVGEDYVPPPALNQAELSSVISGHRLFKMAGFPLPHKFLYQAVPLGTTDMVIAVAEAPMTDLGGTTEAIILYSLLIFFFALLLGSFLYYRLIRQITAPMEEILQATRAISGGDLDYRLPDIADAEMGRIAASFNAMMERLKLVHEENLAQETALALAREEVRHKKILEQKNSEVEAANKELKANLSELSALFQLNEATISTLDINLLLERMIEMLQKMLPHCNLALLLYQPGAEELEVQRTAGLAPALLKEMDLRLDRGLLGQAARKQEMIYLSDLQVDNPRFDYQGKSLPDGSLVCTPMVVKKKLAGLLLLSREKPHAFTSGELRLIQAVGNQAAIGIENARLYEQTRSLSNTDELTSLANRRFFLEVLKRELAQAQRFSSQFSLIMIDIDHFKRYNDCHGHLCGDMALKTVADLLLQNTRGIDLVARFGGEEFVILLPKTSKSGAVLAAEKLRQRIAETVFPGADRSQPGGGLTISLGVAAFPVDSREEYELMDLADRALYEAKEEGRDRTVAWKSL